MGRESLAQPMNTKSPTKLVKCHFEVHADRLSIDRSDKDRLLISNRPASIENDIINTAKRIRYGHLASLESSLFSRDDHSIFSSHDAWRKNSSITIIRSPCGIAKEPRGSGKASVFLADEAPHLGKINEGKARWRPPCVFSLGELTGIMQR